MKEPISIDPENLRVGSFYWARRAGADDAEIVQVTDVFGAAREYWSIAVMGSDQHYSPRDFDFLIRLMKP